MKAAVVAAGLALACASTPVQRDSPSRSAARLLTGEELHHPAAANALDLIRLRRPAFLGAAGPTVVDLAIPYIDDRRAMSINELRLLPTALLAEIRYLTSAEANFRYGRGHAGGAIVVTTRKQLDRVVPDR